MKRKQRKEKGAKDESMRIKEKTEKKGCKIIENRKKREREKIEWTGVWLFN